MIKTYDFSKVSIDKKSELFYGIFDREIEFLDLTEVNNLPKSFFSECSNLKHIKISPKLLGIKTNCFYKTSLELVEFSGTVEQFKAITSYTNIFTGNELQEVQCTDGVVRRDEE